MTDHSDRIRCMPLREERLPCLAEVDTVFVFARRDLRQQVREAYPGAQVVEYSTVGSEPEEEREARLAHRLEAA